MTLTNWGHQMQMMNTWLKVKPWQEKGWCSCHPTSR